MKKILVTTCRARRVRPRVAGRWPRTRLRRPACCACCCPCPCACGCPRCGSRGGFRGTPRRGAAAATPAPTPNKGDNAWMIVATAAGDHDVDPRPGAVLRRPGPLEEHAVDPDAGVRDLLADRRAVGHLRLQRRVHRGQRVFRRLRPVLLWRASSRSRTASARSRPRRRSARASSSPSCSSSCSRRRSRRSPWR